jgi:polyisoprenoid-binding protein YceI
MKRIFYPTMALMIVLGSAFTVLQSQNWKISEDYSIKFSSKDPSGVFRGLKGSVVFDDKNLAGSKFDVTVDVASINTGNGMKNTHAKSAMWFDAEKYPQIIFTSKEIVAAGTGFQAKGVLEIHGVKKDFTIPFTFDKAGDGGTFKAAFDINRMDFNINTAEPDHGASVIKVELNIPVTKS